MIRLAYLIAAGIVLIVPQVLETHEIVDGAGVSLMGANLYVLACLVLFLIGYEIGSVNRGRTQIAAFRRRFGAKPSGPRYISSAFLAILLVWSICGVYVGVRQLTSSIGIQRYLFLLEQGGSAMEHARGDSIGMAAASGGLPGYIKLLNANCVTSLAVVLMMLGEGKRLKGVVGIAMSVMIGACFVLRNIIYIERLTLVILVPLGYHIWRNGGGRVRKHVAVWAGIALALAEIESIRRGYGFGAFGFFALYVQSGMINLSLIQNTFDGAHSFGLMTILTPIYYIAKALGIPFDVGLTFSWVWNAAQNAYGYLYQDFGIWGPLTLAPFGFLCGHLDQSDGPVFNRSVAGLFLRRLKILVAYGCLSMFAVPAFHGPELYFVGLCVFLCSWLEIRRPTLCFRAAGIIGRGRPTRELRHRSQFLTR
jgi:hypothetical protein